MDKIRINWQQQSRKKEKRKWDFILGIVKIVIIQGILGRKKPIFY
jgi:hypothetical protein